MRTATKAFAVFTVIILAALFTTSTALASYSGVNLALLPAAGVWASGEKTIDEWIFSADYAVDGDITTWWNPGKKAQGSELSWLVVDLGDRHELDAVQVFADNSRRRSNFSLLLSTSVDGENWTPMQWLKGSFSYWSSSFLALVDDSLEGVRYVKIAMAGAAGQSRIREIQVWGNADPFVPPNQNHVPLPGSIWLLGSAVAGLAVLRRFAL